MKALLWDLNGVLFNDEAIQKRCWSQVLDLHGVELPGDWWSSLFLGRKAQHTIAALLPHWSQARRDSLMLQKHKLYHQEVSIGVEAAPGSLEMFREAQRRGIPQALVTGASPEELQAAFEHLPPREDFAVIVEGKDVRNGKPHPEGYARACKLLGEPPDKCWAIEDSPVGIEAAQSAGIRCIALTTSCSTAELRQADLVLGELSLNLLDQLG